MSEPETDWKSHCLAALQQLHEALDVIETIESECLLPPQLQDMVDVVLAPRLSNRSPTVP
jgi:hypothetical protein